MLSQVQILYDAPFFAGMAELADALDLGSSVPDVRVQVSLSAPRSLDFIQSKTIKYGDIAQFGRATHLHCVGQRFDPAYLHHLSSLSKFIHLVYLTMITEKFYQLFFKKLETSWKQEIFERKSE